jgi:hypothetical protein
VLVNYGVDMDKVEGVIGRDYWGLRVGGYSWGEFSREITCLHSWIKTPLRIGGIMVAPLQI